MRTLLFLFLFSYSFLLSAQSDSLWYFSKLPDIKDVVEFRGVEMLQDTSACYYTYHALGIDHLGTDSTQIITEWDQFGDIAKYTQFSFNDGDLKYGSRKIYGFDNTKERYEYFSFEWSTLTNQFERKWKQESINFRLFEGIYPLHLKTYFWGETTDQWEPYEEIARKYDTKGREAMYLEKTRNDSTGLLENFEKRENRYGLYSTNTSISYIWENSQWQEQSRFRSSWVNDEDEPGNKWRLYEKWSESDGFVNSYRNRYADTISADTIVLFVNQIWEAASSSWINNERDWVTYQGDSIISEAFIWNLNENLWEPQDRFIVINKSDFEEEIIEAYSDNGQWVNIQKRVTYNDDSRYEYYLDEWNEDQEDWQRKVWNTIDFSSDGKSSFGEHKLFQDNELYLIRNCQSRYSEKNVYDRPDPVKDPFQCIYENPLATCDNIRCYGSETESLLNMEVAVFGMDGKLAAKFDMPQFGTFSFISEQLSPGYYLMVIYENGERIKTEKLIVAP